MEQQWFLYLPVLLCSFAAAFPLIVVAEKKGCLKQLFLGSIALLVLSELFLWFLLHSVFAVSILLFVFFTAFNFLEASLPSLVSRLAPPANKGTALGLFSTAQFFGIFIGGTLGGYLLGQTEATTMSLIIAGCGIFWFLLAWPMHEPQLHKTNLLKT